MINLVVMMCVRLPLSLRNVDDLLFEREIGNLGCCEFGPWMTSELRTAICPCRRQEPALQAQEVAKEVCRGALSVYIHFVPERRIIDRRTYNECGSAALAEWPPLMV